MMKIWPKDNDYQAYEYNYDKTENLPICNAKLLMS